jgi:hypothetical protein
VDHGYRAPQEWVTLTQSEFRVFANRCMSWRSQGTPLPKKNRKGKFRKLHVFCLRKMLVCRSRHTTLPMGVGWPWASVGLRRMPLKMDHRSPQKVSTASADACTSCEVLDGVNMADVVSFTRCMMST